MRHLVLFLVFATVVSASFGCGDGGAAVDAGATSDAVVADAADAALPGAYDDPNDFDRGGCVSSPALSSVDLTGLWHVDLSWPGFGSFPQVIRFDPGPGPGGAPYSVRLFGSSVDRVVVSASDVFMRRQWLSPQGFMRITAATVCAVQGDGSISGHFASCRDDDCSEGAFVGMRVDDVTEPVNRNMTVIAEYAGPSATPWPIDGAITVNVRVRDDVAYVVRYGDGLRIVDLTTPSTPTDLGHAPVAVAEFEIYNDVKLTVGTDAKLYALVASNIRGAVAIDVSDPANPVEVSTFPPPPLGDNTVNVHTLFVEGTTAYLANNTTGGLDIYDVSDPRAPVRLGGYVHPLVGLGQGFVHDLFVSNQVAYLNYWGIGMVLVDASDPASPSVVGTFDAYPRRTSHSTWVTNAGGRMVAVHGDEDFDAHVRIIDVDSGSVAFLNELGSYQTRRHVSVHNILASGNLAFVTYYQDGLRVLDLSTPSQPLEIAHYRTWPGAGGLGPEYGFTFYEGAIGVDYDEGSGRIYVADTHRGLFILELATP